MSAFPSARQANSLPSVIDSPSHEPRFLKNHAGQPGRDIPQCAHIQNALPVRLNSVPFGAPLLSTACESTRLHLLFFPCISPLCDGRDRGWGRRRDSLQQINISTHVSGPSAHRSGWKLLQSFLRRREMMPKPAWGEWNGPGQWRNWGTLGWGSRGWWGWWWWGVSLRIACCWHHHLIDDHWGWRLQRHWGLFPPWRHGRDLIQLQNSPRPSNIPHAWAHAHSPPCLYAFFVCVFECVCVCARVLFPSGRMSASAWTAHIMTQRELVSSCRAELEEKAKCLCVWKSVCQMVINYSFQGVIC